MTLEALAGRSYGPFPFGVAAAKVAEFVAATGDDPDRWHAEAPPGLAAAILFSAAPAFFADDAVTPYLRALIHSEQRFTWHRPMRVGAELTASGTVTSVRARAGLNLVSFVVEAGDGDDAVVTSSSTFLMAAEPVAVPEDDDGEPDAGSKQRDDRPAPVPLPAAGEDLPPLHKSASRLDLVRYAGATLDFNPIHWDHAAARRAGLGGVIVHGLLMGSWILQAASAATTAPAPVRDVRLRFRKPLRPAAQAVVAGAVTARADDVAELKLGLGGSGEELVTATATIRRKGA